MFEFLSRIKSGPTSVRTIPIGELAVLWREPGESEAGIHGVDSGTENIPKKRNGDTDNHVAASSEPMATRSGIDSSSKNDSWYDEKALVNSLKRLLGGGKISAFTCDGQAFYTLNMVSIALNSQREEHNLESMDPGSVIEFFKSGHGLDSGKYMMRFDSGLPVKVYLYSHPADSKVESSQQRPVDESGRQLKSLKPIKGHEK